MATQCPVLLGQVISTATGRPAAISVVTWASVGDDGVEVFQFPWTLSASPTPPLLRYFEYILSAGLSSTFSASFRYGSARIAAKPGTEATACAEGQALVHLG